MATPALYARGVTKTYRMGEVDVAALEGGGLDVPTAGSVCFRDHDLSAASDALRTAYRRDHVGFVFQFLQPAARAARRRSRPTCERSNRAAF